MVKPQFVLPEPGSIPAAVQDQDPPPWELALAVVRGVVRGEYPLFSSGPDAPSAVGHAPAGAKKMIRTYGKVEATASSKNVACGVLVDARSAVSV